MAKSQGARELNLSEAYLEQHFSDLNSNLEKLMKARESAKTELLQIASAQRSLVFEGMPDSKSLRRQEKEAATETSNMIEGAKENVKEIIAVLDQMLEDSNKLLDDLEKDQRALNDFIVEVDEEEIGG